MDDDKPPWYEFLPTVSAAVDIPSREQVYETTRNMIDFGDDGIRGDAFDGYCKELVANIEAQNRIECSKNKSSQLTTSASSMGEKEIQRIPAPSITSVGSRGVSKANVLKHFLRRGSVVSCTPPRN